MRTARLQRVPLARTAMLATLLAASAVIARQQAVDPMEQMPETLRDSVQRVVIISGLGPGDQEVTGTYDEYQAGLLGGMSEGSRIGTISKDIGGAPVGFSIPILSNIGMIYGGLSGAAKERTQAFRDAMAEELADTGRHSLTNDGIALDVFWSLDDLPRLGKKLIAPAAEIPADTDAVLYVGINGLQIDVQGGEAILTTWASASLRRHDDGRILYQTAIRYEDRDDLERWIADDKALWRSYANFARHYLGRELAADLFKRVRLRHELIPVATDTARHDRKDKQLLVAQTLAPTLAWQLEIEDEFTHPAWANAIDEVQVLYDLEIYDARQLVYAEERLAEPTHALQMDLEPCQVYRWSVRPSYHTGTAVYYGDWMRMTEAAPDPAFGKGLKGRRASDSPAYTQDFARLKTDCRRR